MALQLRIGLVSNPRTWPLLDGTIKTEGIDLLPTPVREPHLGLDTIANFGPDGKLLYKYGPGETMYDLHERVQRGELDAGETAITIAIAGADRGDDRYTALPIFMSRRFFHMDIVVHKSIKTPEDLKGKHIFVGTTPPQVWNRGMLEHEFGVDPKSVTYWRHGAAGLAPRPDIRLNKIPSGKNVTSMLESGELQASVSYPPGTANRYSWKHPDFGPLFPNTYEEGVRYYSKTGLFPMNHVLLIKRDIVEQNPWVFTSLFKAFQEAAELADQRRLAHVGYHLELGLLPHEAEKTLRMPLVRHGIQANRRVLDTYVQYAYEHGLTSRLLRVEEIFASSAAQT
jgi:4,5-dihydroxyphthalate decarboxylase